MTEEEVAAAYRAQAVARLQAQQDQAAALAGDPDAAAAVLAGWQPLIDAAIEARIEPLPTPEELQAERERARRTRLLTKPGMAGLPIKDFDV